MPSTRPASRSRHILSWRERLLIAVGPGVLAGITLGDWLKLLGENHFSVDFPYLPRALAISGAATSNSIFRWYEERRYGASWRDVPVPDPLFVLGHWRSGTTHLQYLLGCDDRFAYPNFYQVLFPHTFLSTERRASGLMASLTPELRAYDNVRQDVTVPCEDEFAMCVSSFLTSYLSGVFPRRAAHYDKCLTFRGAPRQVVDEWKASFLWFLKKLMLKNAKPLILKSPPHTCRIKLLLELFPDAKFVHIHRDPYAVFRSMVHTYSTGLPFGRLQRTDEIDWAEVVIRQYRAMYDAFFEERGLIAPGRFHEIRFADLEADPLTEIRKLYEALSLPDFGYAEPALRKYLQSVSNYRKNVFREVPSDVRRRLADEWRRCFEEWGYPV